MAEITLQSQPLNIVQTDEVQTKTLKINTGGKSFIVDAQQGMYMGAEKIADAPFSVDYDGKLIADTGTFKGDISGATGTFSGKIEIKDGSGNVVILLDPS